MKSVKRTDWGRRTPPIGGTNFELYAWFFMRISGLFLVLLAAGHMFIMHVFNDTLNLDYEFVAARWDTPCLLYTSHRCRRIERCRSRWSPYH